MNKNLSKLLIYFLIVSVLPTSIIADGGFVSDGKSDFFASSQNFVITWDQNKEILILSTKVKSENLSNFGWIIPIKTNTKPEVELGNVSIFYDLNKYFQPPRKLSIFSIGLLTTQGMEHMEGFEILESKELGIYDITILKATDSDKLYDWLKINNFGIKENAKQILDLYTNENFFFITVKIDLLNKYENEINFINNQNFIGNSTKDKIKNALSSLRYVKGRGFLSDVVTRDILLNKPYEESIISKNDLNLRFNLLSQTEYDELREKYYLDTRVQRTFFDNENFFDFWFKESLLKVTCFNRPKYIPIDKKRVNDKDYKIVVFESGTGGSSHHLPTCDNNKILSPDEIQEMKDFFKEFAPKVSQYSIELEKHLHRKFFDNENIQKILTLEHVIWDLTTGVSSPLKIGFETNEPYYPMKISSINEGNVSVIGYVLSEEPMKDSTKLLSTVKSKRLDTKIKKELSVFIDVENLDYATKFSFDGASSEFVSDIIFQKMNDNEKDESLEKESIFKRLFRWLFR